MKCYSFLFIFNCETEDKAVMPKNIRHFEFDNVFIFLLTVLDSNLLNIHNDSEVSRFEIF